jgi:uncharacterized protein
LNRLLCATALVLAAQVVQAAEPSEASLETLMVVTRAERNIDAVFSTMQPMLKRMRTEMMPGVLSAEEEKRLDAMEAKMLAVMRDELSWARLKPMTMQIYRESFTQSEVDGLIAFYQSPAGQAFVEKMPMVMQKSMLITQSRMKPMMERIQQIAQEAAAEGSKK